MTERTKKKLYEKLQRLPNSSGIYRMLDAKGKLLYIGKAKNLRKRVNSYFNRHHQTDIKTSQLITKVDDVEVILLENEVEALLLERNLIKEYKPPFNILLQDDKQYPFIRVDLNEKWPRFEQVRRKKKDKALKGYSCA